MVMNWLFINKKIKDNVYDCFYEFPLCLSLQSVLNYQRIEMLLNNEDHAENKKNR